MARTKVLTTVYLDPAQDRDLRALREKTNVPVSVMIREAIDLYLDDHRDQIPVIAPDPRQVPMDFTPEEPEIEIHPPGIWHCYGAHCFVDEGRGCNCLCAECERANRADR